ncbi:MAG: hypothetical protein J6C84_04610 [Lachnospiraceae bacterium]|nr:hypothetical protein [Lachnospiraceae bacterium]
MWKEIIGLLYVAVLGAMDIREKKVPVWLLILGAMETIMVRLAEGFMDGWQKNTGSILWGMLPGLFLLAMAYLTKKAGYGDGVVLCLLGIRCGYRFCLAIFCMSLLLLSLTCMVLLLLKRVRRNTRIPYLPFLTVVYAGYLVFGERWQ